MDFGLCLELDSSCWLTIRLINMKRDLWVKVCARDPMRDAKLHSLVSYIEDQCNLHDWSDTAQRVCATDCTTTYEQYNSHKFQNEITPKEFNLISFVRMRSSEQ